MQPTSLFKLSFSQVSHEAAIYSDSEISDIHRPCCAGSAAHSAACGFIFSRAELVDY